MSRETVTMPQLGESVVEGTVSKWLKAPGEAVGRFESLLEVNTDKVNTEIPSPVAGVLVEVLVEEGETVSVGTPLAVVEMEGGGEAKAPVAEPVAETVQTPEPKAAPVAEPGTAVAAVAATAPAVTTEGLPRG